MLIGDWAQLGLGGAQLLGLGATWLYLRGKLDGSSASEGVCAGALARSQAERLAGMEEELQSVRESAAKTATALDYHLGECARQYLAVADALRALERRLAPRLRRS